MTDRKLNLLSDSLSKLLVDQLGHELKNYNLYKSFANFFGVKGLDDLQTYFDHRAEEEKNHANWIHKYLSDGDYMFTYPAIEKNDEEFSSLIDPFVLTVIREIETTQLIYKIYETAKEEGDYMTSSWLYKLLIKEQIEEENTSRMAQTIMELDGDIFKKSGKVLELLNLDARAYS